MYGGSGNFRTIAWYQNYLDELIRMEEYETKLKLHAKTVKFTQKIKKNSRCNPKDNQKQNKMIKHYKPKTMNNKRG